MNELNKQDIEEKFDWGKKWQQEIDDYNNGDEKYRQEYWDKYIFQSWWYNGRGTSLPNDIKKLRETEKDFEKYIPGIMEGLEEEGYTGDIEKIFKLDEQAKKYLENIGYFESEKIKNEVEKLIK